MLGSAEAQQQWRLMRRETTPRKGWKQEIEQVRKFALSRISVMETEIAWIWVSPCVLTDPITHGYLPHTLTIASSDTIQSPTSRRYGGKEMHMHVTFDRYFPTQAINTLVHQ